MVEVVAVIGAGRSGSTLLGSLVGQHPDFVDVGEAASFVEKAVHDDRLCGCGAPFSSCPFWSQVRTSLEAAPAFPGWPTIQSGMRASDSLRPSRTRPNADAANEFLLAFYETIAAVAGVPRVIDTSTDSSYALTLLRVPGLAVRTVHLVREPQAVAHSWRRRKRDWEVHWDEQYMERRNHLHSGARWLAENALAEMVGSRSPRHVRVRYEQLVADPVATLASIGVDGAEDYVTEHGIATFAPTHSVAGNPSRFATNGEVALRADDAWRTDAAPVGSLAVRLLTSPLRARYGYAEEPRR